MQSRRGYDLSPSDFPRDRVRKGLSVPLDLSPDLRRTEKAFDHPRGTRPLVETGVGEARDKTAAGVEDSPHLADRAVGVLDLQQGHAPGDGRDRPGPQELDSARVPHT